MTITPGRAFVSYLNGMVYEEARESDPARIDYSKAVDGYQVQSSITGFGVSAALMKAAAM